MKPKNNSSFMTILTLILLTSSCGQKGDVIIKVREFRNHPPVINIITANPFILNYGDTTMITAAANDPDGDPLTYSWSSPDSEILLASTGNPIRWISPAYAGSFIIKLTITDPGGKTATGEVIIAVQKPESYNRSIIIDNTVNAKFLTDYQVLIIMDTRSIISAGKMNPDGSDVKFADSDGKTQLSYWIESGINTTTTRIWIKIPNIPAYSTKIIYIYYGNTNLTETSSSVNVFGADIEFNSTSGWIEVDPHGEIEIGTNRRLNFSKYNNNPTYVYHLLSNGLTNFIVDFIIYWETLKSGYGYIGFADEVKYGVIDDSNFKNFLMTFWGQKQILIREINSGTSRTETPGQQVTESTIYYATFKRLSNHAEFLLYNDPGRTQLYKSVIKEIGVSATFNVFYILTSAAREPGDGINGWIDNVIFREYIYPEPTVTISSENPL